MEKKWEEMSSDEKQEALFHRWLSPKDPQGNDLKFQSPQAEKAYKERITRIKDAIQMKKLPDRVPVFVLPSFFPVYNAGITPREAMYDYDKCYHGIQEIHNGLCSRMRTLARLRLARENSLTFLTTSYIPGLVTGSPLNNRTRQRRRIHEGG